MKRRKFMEDATNKALETWIRRTREQPLPVRPTPLEIIELAPGQTLDSDLDIFLARNPRSFGRQFVRDRLISPTPHGHLKIDF